MLSEAAIRKQAASAPGKSPVKSGRKVLPAKFDEKLVDLCVEMREMRMTSSCGSCKLRRRRSC